MKYTLTYNWHAIYVRSRSEKQVFDRFVEQGIEAFLPLRRKLRRWSDRKKWIEVPYINSYVFVRSSEKEYFDILNTIGAIKFITFEGSPAPIPDWQIDAMKKIVISNEKFRFSNQYFKKGDKINIETGPLLGFTGEVVRDSDGRKKVAIRIEQIGYAMLVEMDILDVKKTNS